MNILNSVRFKTRWTRSHKRLRTKIFSLCVISVLMLNATACNHDNSNGNHNGITPQTVEVIATLIGATVEAGLLFLTKNRFMVTAISGTVGVGAKYLINESGLTCKACGTPTPFKDKTVMESEPGLISCSNPDCRRYAYLVVSSFQDRIAEILQQAKESIPPTCLLAQQADDNGDIRLIWYSHNGTSASLNGQLVNTNDSMPVYPTETTTYILKVIGKYGKSEDSVTVEIQQEELEPEGSDPADGSNLTPPISKEPGPSAPRHRIIVYLNKIVVHEDGSLGATDWSFGLFLNERNFITIPKQSYHDDDRNVVKFNDVSGEGIVDGDEVTLRIRGYNFGDRRIAEGKMNVSLSTVPTNLQKTIEVTVPENYKKGNFIFYVTITKQN
jgi:hypothetical protein